MEIHPYVGFRAEKVEYTINLMFYIMFKNTPSFPKRKVATHFLKFNFDQKLA
jgi:hypothetical protein